MTSLRNPVVRSRARWTAMLLAAGAMVACSTLPVLSGRRSPVPTLVMEAWGPVSDLGRTMARTEAARSAGLWAGDGPRLVWERMGAAQRMRWVADGGATVKVPRATLEGGRWHASATVERSSQWMDELRRREIDRAEATATAGDPATAIRLAEWKAVEQLVRASLRSREAAAAGRVELTVLLADREVEVDGRAATVRLWGAVRVESEGPLASADAARMLVDLAEGAWQTGRRSEAVELLRNAVALQPEDVTVLLTLGSRLIDSGDPADALDPLRRAVSLSTDPAIQDALIRALDAAGRPAEAATLRTRVEASARSPTVPITERRPRSPDVERTLESRPPPSDPVAQEGERPDQPTCPEGMVRLEGGSVSTGAGTSVVAPFCLDRLEAHLALWGDGDSLRPIANVSWAEADRRCAARGARLPTEAEWAWAARGSSGRPYPWGGSVPTCEVANTSGCRGAAVATGSTAGDTTPEGVQDLGGNMREWVQDAWDRTANPTAAAAARVIRGGGWSSAATWASTTARQGYGLTAAYRSGDLGFRCARSLGSSDGR